MTAFSPDTGCRRLVRRVFFCLAIVLTSGSATAEPGGLPGAPTPTDLLPPAPGQSQLFAERAWRQTGGGTGFFVTADGKLMTNNHVVTGCAGYSVETTEGREVEASLLAADAEEDLALLQAPLPGAAPLAFRRVVATRGQPILIIGYPSYGMQRIQPTPAAGTLNGPPSPDGHRFQFQAEVRPGNSGGPIFDGEGLVVGVVFARINSAAVYQKTGQQVRDVGFGISNETSLAFLASHGIAPLQADERPGPAWDEQALFAAAQRSLARVLCWKPR